MRKRNENIHFSRSGEKFLFLLSIFLMRLILSSMPGQDQIELELATKEKEVEESERNLMNYEQTLVVRIELTKN